VWCIAPSHADGEFSPNPQRKGCRRWPRGGGGRGGAPLRRRGVWLPPGGLGVGLGLEPSEHPLELRPRVRAPLRRGGGATPPRGGGTPPPTSGFMRLRPLLQPAILGWLASWTTEYIAPYNEVRTDVEKPTLMTAVERRLIPTNPMISGLVPGLGKKKEKYKKIRDLYRSHSKLRLSDKTLKQIRGVRTHRKRLSGGGTPTD